MANKGVCSKNITIDGAKVSFATHKFFVLGPDGGVLRVRHYRDLLRTGVFSGERPVSNIISSDGPSDFVHVLALDKRDPMPSFEDVRMLLGWAERGPDGFVIGFDAKKTEAGLPGAILGKTRDARRATNVKMPADRTLLGEGGWGHKRSPVNELLMLARSDRSSDMYYESAKDRGARRRTLVKTLVGKDPGALSALIAALRTKDNLRTPALMLAVDALLAGHPEGERLLGDVLLRPDQPGQALRYFFDAYRDGVRGGIPSSLRRAVAGAATRLYTEDAVVRFDRVRTVGVEDRSAKGSAVKFADVLSLTHPVPQGEEQSQLFGFLTGSGRPTPLLAVRDTLMSLSPELAARELQFEAARLARGGAPGMLSRLPWETLAAVSTGPRTDIADAEASFADAKASRERFREASREVFAKERRLRTRVRDAVRNTHPRGAGAPDPAIAKARLAQARAELQEFRSSVEYKDAVEGMTAARNKVRDAGVRLAVTASAGGKVHPAVWPVALPSLSDGQVLSLLGAFDRSGVDGAFRDRVTERLSAARPAIPDILRTARGAALATAHLAAPADTVAFRTSGAWTSLPPSSWEAPLETLVGDRVAEKLPEIKGRVLILVDGSGSMQSEVSGRRNDHRAAGYQSLTCADVAGFAASAIASRCSTPADVFVYDTEVASGGCSRGVLRLVSVEALPGGVLAGSRTILGKVSGGGTDTHAAIASTWNEHDLLIILTDEQTSFVPGQKFAHVVGYPTSPESAAKRSFRLPESAKVVTVNLAGYSGAQFPDSENRRSISGWSEALFEEVASLATQDVELESSPTPFDDEAVARGNEARRLAERARLAEEALPGTSLADGRVYRVGDVGPAGGIVVFVGGLGESLEVPLPDWNGSEFGDPARSWADAVRLAEGCSFGGYADWRLPGKDELFEKVYPFTRSVERYDGKTYVHERRELRTGRDGDRYWSSWPVGSDDAWFVWMDDGRSNTGSTTNRMYVLPVRSF